MKLSVEIAEIRSKVGDEKAIELTKAAGFDCVDYSFYGLGEGAPALGENYREYALKLRKILDKNGLECNQAHAPFNLTKDKKQDISERHYLEIVRSIEAAAILGAKNIVVHPIYVPVGETVNGVSYEEFNRRYYKSLEPYCEKFKINIAVENMFYIDSKRGCLCGMLDTPQSLTNMVRSIDSPYFVACADVGHLAVTGTEPEDFIKQMDAAVLKTLHIQDTDYKADRHQLPFVGEINWKNVMSALKGIGYSGDLTFEITGFLNNLPSELLPAALKYCAEVGKYLMALYKCD